MQASTPTRITVSTTVNAPIEKVWECWNKPEHVTKWNNASPDWHTPRAANDLRTGGNFSYRMEARDGSMGFDFEGTYDEVTPNQRIAYTMSDGRKVDAQFRSSGNTTEIVQTFDAEDQNPADFQKAGWQAIMDNFRKYVEEG